MFNFKNTVKRFRHHVRRPISPSSVQ